MDSVHNLSQPAALWVALTGDILVDGNVVPTFRRFQKCRVMNPTNKKVMETGEQLLSQMWPLLWHNVTIQKE